MTNRVLSNKLAKMAALAVRPVSAIAIGFLLSASVTTGHARDLGAVGGGGGAEFRSACNPDDVMIGVNMRSGTALDAIVPICIHLNPQKTEWTGQAYEPTQYFGGTGGGYQKIACQPGDAVRHLHVHAGPWGTITVVKQVFMTCQDLDSGRWYDVFPGQRGEAVTTDQRFSCGDGEWGSAIYGRYGMLVDRLGFACEKITAAAATPPPPPPPSPGGGEKAVQVVLSVDVYDAAGGNGQRTGVLEAGTANVTLVQPQAPWYQLKWPQGQGWVYSAPDYQSLKLP